MTAHMRFRESITTGMPPIGMPRFEATKILGRIGNLQVRIAQSAREVEAAQELRHRVFFCDGSTDGLETIGRDADQFDDYCDHLIVLDTAIQGPAHKQIVGTYRLLRQSQAQEAGGFYSQNEFNLAALLNRFPERRVLELGRSCVLPEYRTKRTVELLWQGIWACCRDWNIDVMCGCASFHGCNPASHALPLSFLHHHARAMGKWLVSAHPRHKIEMDLMPVEAVDFREAMNVMPPLIKGYLRVGALFGDGAVVDHEFGTTDVFVVLPVERITSRYVSHFGVDAARFA